MARLRHVRQSTGNYSALPRRARTVHRAALPLPTMLAVPIQATTMMPASQRGNLCIQQYSATFDWLEVPIISGGWGWTDKFLLLAPNAPFP